MDFINLVLLPFILSFLFTTIFTPFSLVFIKKFGLIDHPKKHVHPAIIHKEPVPRGGGIPIFLGIILSGLFLLPLNTITVGIYIAAFISMVTGIADDKLNSKSKDLSPIFRLFVNIVCAVIIVACGISIKYITNPWGGTIDLEAMKIPLFIFPFSLLFSDLLTIIWIVWVINMLNWSKGIDGQMPGIVAISAIVIGILSLRFIPIEPNSVLDAKLSFIISGAAIGFLLFNFYPAKIFPGYGATGLYLLLATASILSGAKLATAILVMGVPFVDALFTIGRRIYKKNSPFRGDDKHLHHILLRLGMSQRQIALFYWIISAILGVISLALQSSSKIMAIIMLISVTMGALFFLHSLVKNDKKRLTT